MKKKESFYIEKKYARLFILQEMFSHYGFLIAAIHILLVIVPYTNWKNFNSKLNRIKFSFGFRKSAPSITTIYV